MERAIYVVSGLPGTGKSTVSRLLAKRFERGVHIESDLLQQLIVTGGLWPDGEPQEEAHRQLRMRDRLGCMLADAFFEENFSPVIDAVVIGSHVDKFWADIRNRPLLFVLLTPDLDVVSQRDATRPEKHVFDKWGYLDAAMRNETPKVGLWLDSSRMTADETVDEILRRVGEARID